LFPSVDSPSSPFVVTGASYRRPGPALLQPQTAVVTLIPPLTVVVGPGVSRTYMLAAHTTIEADGRRIYTSDGHTIYTTDGRRTYLPDARRTYRRK
jgi:hypothetical protein